LKSKSSLLPVKEGLSTKVSYEQVLQNLLKELVKEQDFKLSQLVKIFQEAKEEQMIPLSIFSYKLHPLESLSKYLKEVEKLSYQKIALLLDRNDKSVWAAYQRSKKKMRAKFIFGKEMYNIPISIFADHNFSLLENVVIYLFKIHQLTNPQIAKLLKKSPNSIAVLKKRALEKDE